MTKSESIFSIRGIVRGYRERHLPGEVPAQIFFLTAPGEPEIPITQEDTRIAMRDGHDLEVFYLHDAIADRDTPLMVNNYSTQRLETLATPLLGSKNPKESSIETKYEIKNKQLEENLNKHRQKFRIIMGSITLYCVIAILGINIWSLLVTGATWMAIFIISSEEKEERSAPSRNPWERRREMLEDYIKDKYGDLVTAEEPPEKPN